VSLVWDVCIIAPHLISLAIITGQSLVAILANLIRASVTPLDHPCARREGRRDWLGDPILVVSRHHVLEVLGLMSKSISKLVLHPEVPYVSALDPTHWKTRLSLVDSSNSVIRVEREEALGVDIDTFLYE
jgi:hypothetical protein